VSIFLAQATGIDLSLTQQLGLLGILLVTSKGGAGVAGSAIVVLVSTLAATGVIPVAAVALILGVHRLLSSAFVAINILGNALATLVIGQWEGAVDRRLLVAGLAEVNAMTPAHSPISNG
jgi:aerobic C4-dicarboxylate transport protein